MSAGDPATGVARSTMCASRWPAAGQDRDFRLSRIQRLRQMLDAGTYGIPPEQVATKMIGRAICDQVAHLVDS